MLIEENDILRLNSINDIVIIKVNLELIYNKIYLKFIKNNSILSYNLQNYLIDNKYKKIFNDEINNIFKLIQNEKNIILLVNDNRLNEITSKDNFSIYYNK